MYRRAATSLAVILLSVLALACENSSGSKFGESGGTQPPIIPPPGLDENPSGIWNGTLTSDTGGQQLIVGIITQDRLTHLVDPFGRTQQYIGTTLVSGTDMTSSLDEYRALTVNSKDQEIVGPWSIAGTVLTATSISGIYSGQIDSGQIQLFYDSIYERSSDLTKLAGVWRLFAPNFNLTLNITADGMVSGSDSQNCTYTGTISIIDDRFNAYSTSWQVASPVNCGLLPGLYTGVLTLSDTVAVDDTLIFSLSRQTRAIVGAVERQPLP